MARLLDETMTSRIADGLLARLRNSDKLVSLEGQKTTLAGTTATGEPFTTADWEGKVILVDFWATWCAPCIAELPRVKEVYAQYHDQGFEVLGIANDYSADVVVQGSQRLELPWPQLHDAESGSAKKWHSITREFGIDGIPVMLIIDKKGVVRSVTARENFEELIPQLLAE